MARPVMLARGAEPPGTLTHPVPVGHLGAALEPVPVGWRWPGRRLSLLADLRSASLSPPSACKPGAEPPGTPTHPVPVGHLTAALEPGPVGWRWPGCWLSLLAGFRSASLW